MSKADSSIRIRQTPSGGFSAIFKEQKTDASHSDIPANPKTNARYSDIATNQKTCSGHPDNPDILKNQNTYDQDSDVQGRIIQSPDIPMLQGILAARARAPLPHQEPLPHRTLWQHREPWLHRALWQHREPWQHRALWQHREPWQHRKTWQHRGRNNTIFQGDRNRC